MGVQELESPGALAMWFRTPCDFLPVSFTLDTRYACLVRSRYDRPEMLSVCNPSYPGSGGAIPSICRLPESGQAAGILGWFGRKDPLLLPGRVNQVIHAGGIRLGRALRPRQPTAARKSRQ